MVFSANKRHPLNTKFIVFKFQMTFLSMSFFFFFFNVWNNTLVLHLFSKLFNNFLTLEALLFADSPLPYRNWPRRAYYKLTFATLGLVQLHWTLHERIYVYGFFTKNGPFAIN